QTGCLEKQRWEDRARSPEAGETAATKPYSPVLPRFPILGVANFSGGALECGGLRRYGCFLFFLLLPQLRKRKHPKKETKAANTAALQSAPIFDFPFRTFAGCPQTPGLTVPVQLARLLVVALTCSIDALPALSYPETWTTFDFVPN